MRSQVTTLCYIEREDSYLMLHRVKKKNDLNENKWVGIGGHAEEGRVRKTACFGRQWRKRGFFLLPYRFRGWSLLCRINGDGIHVSLYGRWFRRELADCDEGCLEWVPKSEIPNLNLWTGDLFFPAAGRKRSVFFSEAAL